MDTMSRKECTGSQLLEASDSGPLIKNEDLCKEQDDSRSTRDEGVNDCREQE